MAPAEGPTSPENPHEKPSHEKASQEKASDQKAWHEVVLETFKRNDIRLVPYVPDRVLTTLIRKLHADPFFTTFPTAREEEAVGIVSGAWMGGMRGAVLMQTSGAGDPLPDPADHVRVGTQHARRIQLRAVAGVPHHAAGARLAGDGASYRDPAR